MTPWMEKVRCNFDELNKWVQYLPKKFSTSAAATQKLIEQQCALVASMTAQAKESILAQQAEALEQIKQLVAETNSNTNASLEQQLRTLQEDFQRSQADRDRVIAELQQTIQTIRQTPCPACVERTKAKAPVPELPTINAPVDDLDEHEGPSSN